MIKTGWLGWIRQIKITNEIQMKKEIWIINYTGISPTNEVGGGTMLLSPWLFIHPSVCLSVCLFMEKGFLHNTSIMFWLTMSIPLGNSFSFLAYSDDTFTHVLIITHLTSIDFGVKSQRSRTNFYSKIKKKYPHDNCNDCTSQVLIITKGSTLLILVSKSQTSSWNLDFKRCTVSTQ